MKTFFSPLVIAGTFFRPLNGWRILLLVIVFTGCGSPGPVKYRNDSLTSGTIHISVDESFRPVIDSQIQVFESQNPGAKIIAEYKSEAACFRDLQADSTRMIIVTRGLSHEEEMYFKDTLTYIPRFGRIAYDAIAAIVNTKSKDSVFSMADIRSLLKGTSGYKLKVVLDGTSATSTVRYMMDSVLRGQPLDKSVTAAKSSEELVSFVANNEDAIGFVGVEWVGNHEDSTQLSFMNRIKIASVQCTGCAAETYVKPYQANIAMKRYPMVRGLYYILKEGYDGLGSGFVNFLDYEKGQLIFRRAYLVPAKMSFEIRSTEINK